MDLSLVEEITIYGKNRKEKIWALVDSGAQRTSIDRTLAKKIGLKKTGKTIVVKSSNGLRKRELAEITLSLKNKKFKVMANLSNREKMRFKALIGRDILYKGCFKIDIRKTEKQFQNILLPRGFEK